MKIILFEGRNAVGKTAVMQQVRHMLLTENIKTEILVDGGSTVFGKKIGHMFETNNLSAETELLLYLAARSELVQTHIDKLKQENCKFIFLDRFSPSTFVYQGKRLGIPLLEFYQIENFARNSLVPDISFLLEVSDKTCFSRLEQRDNIVLDELQKIQLSELSRDYRDVFDFLEWKYEIIENEKKPIVAAKFIFDRIIELNETK